MFSWFVFPCSIVFVWYDRFLSSWIYEAGNEPNTSLKQTASLWVTVEHTLSNHVTVMTSALYQPLSRVHKLTHMSAGLKGKALFQCSCMWHENGNCVIQSFGAFIPVFDSNSAPSLSQFFSSLPRLLELCAAAVTWCQSCCLVSCGLLFDLQHKM